MVLDKGAMFSVLWGNSENALGFFSHSSETVIIKNLCVMPVVKYLVSGLLKNTFQR